MRLLTSRSPLPSRLLLSCLLGALSFLASACGGHTFSGKMSFFNIPTPYRTTGSVATGSDGNIWFPTIAYDHFGTNQPSGEIGRITPDGKISMFPLPTPNSYPEYIVAAPDGNLWFTAIQGSGKVRYGVDTPPGFEHTVSEIGYLTTAGKFTFLNPLPSGIFAVALANGPDGHVWFAEEVEAGMSNLNRTYKLASVTSTASGGMLRTFSLPLLQQYDDIESLVSGPDGNLWFGISGTLLPSYAEFGKIGRMTPQGSLQVFSLGKFIEEHDLAVGPDKNLWFIAGSGVGRVNTDGKLLPFFTPPDLKTTYGYRASGIVAGPDNGLWYAGGTAGINRVSTDGVFTAYTIPAGANEQESYLRRALTGGMAFASDGTLWFLDVNEIGHMV